MLQLLAASVEHRGYHDILSKSCIITCSRIDTLLRFLLLQQLLILLGAIKV
jgi:hypothetical protein